MKKILVIALAFIMAFTFVACANEETGSSKFESFEEAAYSTPSSEITVSTKLVSALGELNSQIQTRFNPDGSAVIDYYIERFDEDFTSDSVISSKSGTVTYADGKYSDGGELVGEVSAVTEINLSFAEDKMEYSINGDVLTATVKAENTKAVLGIEIAADVTLVVTKNATKIVSATMNYTIADIGDFTVICTYN